MKSLMSFVVDSELRAKKLRVADEIMRAKSSKQRCTALCILIFDKVISLQVGLFY